MLVCRLLLRLRKTAHKQSETADMGLTRCTHATFTSTGFFTTYGVVYLGEGVIECSQCRSELENSRSGKLLETGALSQIEDTQVAHPIRHAEDSVPPTSIRGLRPHCKPNTAENFNVTK